MPRARTHLTWRARVPILDRTRTYQGELQTLRPDPSHITEYRWVTVARGNPEDITQIAKALNKARFTLFDLHPKQTKEKQRVR